MVKQKKGKVLVNRNFLITIILSFIFLFLLNFIQANIGLSNDKKPSLQPPIKTGITNINNSFTNITNIYNNNTYNVTYNITNNITIDANFTNVAFLNQTNTFTSGYQQNFLDNITANNYNFQVSSKTPFYRNLFGFQPDNGFSHKNRLDNGLTYWYGNVTDLFIIIGANPQGDINANILEMTHDITPVATDIGDFPRDAIAGYFFVYDNGTDKFQRIEIATNDGLVLGGSLDNVYNPYQAPSFRMYGDNQGNQVFNIEEYEGGDTGYDVEIGNVLLPYKTNLYVYNGNASISDCIILGGNAICNWNEAGNSSWNQALADTLYKPITFTELPINLANSGNVTGVLPITNGGTGQNSFASGIIQSTGSSLISNTTAVGLWDTAYHSNRDYLDVIDQNLNINAQPYFNALRLNGSRIYPNTSGIPYGLVVDNMVKLGGRTFLGQYNEFIAGFGVTLNSSQMENAVGAPVGFGVDIQINDTTGRMYFGTQYNTKVYSNNYSTQFVNVDIRQRCYNNISKCVGFNLLDDAITNSSKAGLSIAVFGSLVPYGNKAISIVDGGIYMDSGGGNFPRFMTSESLSHTGLFSSGDIESLGTIYSRYGFFQEYVNYPNPALKVRGNYDEFGGEMQMNLSTVENYINQTVWAVDNKGNQWSNGTINVGNLITLQSITLPTCNAGTSGSIGRNATKLYFCDGSVWNGLY